MKKFIIPIVALIVLIVGWYLYKDSATKDVGENSTVVVTDFAEKGVLEFSEPGENNPSPYLLYGDDSARLRKNLILDAESICVSGSGGLPCVAMSVTWDVAFGGKQAIVEGVMEGDSVRVKKLRVLEEWDLGLVPAPGTVYISWTEAKSLLDNCRVEMIARTHARDVNLKLKDGREVRAVELTSTDTSNAIAAARSKCGDLIEAME